MAEPYPWFYAVNDRPLMLAELPDGGLDSFVFDWNTATMVRDSSCFAHVIPGSGKDVDRLTAEEFAARVVLCQVDVLHKWCERMSTFATGSAAELASLAGKPGASEPLAFGAEQIHVDVDAQSITLQLPHSAITRADLHKRFGPGTAVAGAPQRTWFRVGAARAHHRCMLLASADAPDAAAPVTCVTLVRERNLGAGVASLAHGWAERLCRVPSTSKADLAAALGGAAHALPEGVTQIDLDDREVGLGGVNVRFTRGQVRRADIVALFGAGTPLPRLAPHHPHRVMHEVKRPGAPQQCTVFAEYGEEPTDDVARGVKLRVDAATPDA